MAKTLTLDWKKMLEALVVSSESVTKAEEFSTEQMNVVSSILELTDITQEKEYQLCRRSAEHLLENVPEPENIDLE
jgi:hypothetical protein